jgi:hypothetical protein
MTIPVVIRNVLRIARDHLHNDRASSDNRLHVYLADISADPSIVSFLTRTGKGYHFGSPVDHCVNLVTCAAARPPARGIRRFMRVESSCKSAGFKNTPCKHANLNGPSTDATLFSL